jgi:hypothetical protein
MKKEHFFFFFVLQRISFVIYLFICFLKDGTDENIIPLHDDLQENILEKSNNLNNHPLINEIQLWEINSIELIHQTADQLRKDLLSIVEKSIEEIKLKLEYLTDELKKARINDQFFENDLKEWINQLNQFTTIK